MVIRDPLLWAFSWRFQRTHRTDGLNESEVFGLMWRSLYLEILRDISMYHTHLRLLEQLHAEHSVYARNQL